jgi:integrase
MVTRKRRRPRNSGSIVHRTNGRVEARWLDPATGTYRTATVGSDAEARSVLAQLAAGTYQPKRRRPSPAPSSGVLTLNDFVEPFLRHCQVQQVDPDTIRRTYRPALGRVLVSIGHNPLAAVDAATVTDALADMQRRGYAPSTVRLSRRLLRLVFALAEDRGLVQRNPVRGRPPKAAPRPLKRISAALAVQILRAVRETAAEGPVTLGLWYGLRFGEVMGLRWLDVTPEVLIVRGQRRQNGTYKAQTKGKKEREIPIIPPVRRVFDAAREDQTAARLLAGDGYEPSGYVFTDARGRPLSRERVRGPYDRALAAAGLPPLTFHDLRHMTATLLRRAGIPEEVRRAIIGHESAEVHIGYQHISLDDKIAALERLQGLIDGGDGG